MHSRFPEAEATFSTVRCRPRNGVPMRRLLLVPLSLIAALGCDAAAPEPADLLIANARILTGSEVIERGSILVRDGRIEAVVEDEPGDDADAEPAHRVLDADGLTALPGLIDVHRHLLPYSGATSEGELQRYIGEELPGVFEGLLSAGLTTVMSPGDFRPEIFEVRSRLRRGDLLGPRLLSAGPIFTAPDDHPAGGPVCGSEPFCRGRVAVETDDPDSARVEVRRLEEMGADAIKVVIDRRIVPDAMISQEVLEAVVEEAELLGLPVMVHAEYARDMVRAVEAGADRLVHTPVVGSVEELGAAALLREAGVGVATTVSWTSSAVASAMGMEWDGREHRQALGNIRHMMDEGVLVAFGTDNPPPLGLTTFMVEVEALGTVLSPAEVIETMTIDAARYLEIDDSLGTLEPGKVADLVLVDGDPLEDLSALSDVVTVVKAGRIASDERSP